MQWVVKISSNKDALKMIVFQKRKHERQQIHCAAYLFIDNIFIAQWPWDK